MRTANENATNCRNIAEVQTIILFRLDGACWFMYTRDTQIRVFRVFRQDRVNQVISPKASQLVNARGS